MSAVNEVNQPMPILVIEDDQSLSRSIQLNLSLAGFDCVLAHTCQQAGQLLSEKNFEIIVCDQQLPDLAGIEFIKTRSKEFPFATFILMTGFGSPEFALSAIRAGASDYISKPFSVEDLVFLLNKVKARSFSNARTSNPNDSFKNIIAQSQSMQAIFSTIKRIANFSTTVLIQGESGTGKELIARALHNSSNRADKPFVAINCGAIPENLIESELFGHKKGAFTDAIRDKIGLFEEANGGTVFLDEVGELPLALQVKLLRVLQEQQIQPVGDEKLKQIDVRIIAATLRDLEADVKTKRFRDDLFFRLNVINLYVPALRDRPEDIPALVQYFLDKYNKKLGTKITGIETSALQKLMTHAWRGNVRELENCIERALVLTDQIKIDLASLPAHIRGQSASPNNMVPVITDNLSIKQHTTQIEQTLISKALDQTNGNRTKAALLLEISHRALLYKLKEYRLEGYKKTK